MEKEISMEIWEKLYSSCKYAETETLSEDILEKTLKIFNVLFPKIKEAKKSKIVVSIYGGSGVGKTTVTTLLNYIFLEKGIKTFVLSGDDYPRRIPLLNDNERIRVYREAGLKGLVSSKQYTEERMHILKELLDKDLDYAPEMVEKHKWLESYQDSGRKQLSKYLGTDMEIDFNEISEVIKNFKEGIDEIFIRSLGRVEGETFYYKEDFSDVEVMILEWTHGNSDYLTGVDIPIFLVSTPEETLEWRKIRNKDTGVGNPFTNQVLEIEQMKLNSQAKKAELIVSLKGDFLTYEDFAKLN